VSLDPIKDWVRANRWLVAAAVLVFGGYTLGKDMALRDNARDLAGARVEAN
jgi:hypothetical protein